ncbi:AGAP000787-PA-like protein [Anopheles sinensis]|uniref:HECT-type E3 ubiquitin transferase n=1 Tax=Anopheles sinensis TaxID=74873 RepID=A0A084VIV1_ANOSI|nr:AGAP000787-PA-like protein [Anopheles sinensis]
MASTQGEAVDTADRMNPVQLNAALVPFAPSRFVSLADQQSRFSNDNAGYSRVLIKVIAGRQLAKKDIFGASDPYVRIDLNTIDGDVTIQSELTKTKKKTLDPVWHETFTFRVKPSVHKLVFQVFDENRLTRDDFLGMVEIVLSQLPKEQPGVVVPTKSYPLLPRSARSNVRGQLELYCAFIQDENNTETDWELIESSSAATVCEAAPCFPPFVGTKEIFLLLLSQVTNTPHRTSGSSNSNGNSNNAAYVLPEGWEERLDANGRIYYVNHVARSTQWERPTAVPMEVSPESDMDAAFQRRVHISVDDSATSDSVGSRATSAVTSSSASLAESTASLSAPRTDSVPDEGDEPVVLRANSVQSLRSLHLSSPPQLPAALVRSSSRAVPSATNRSIRRSMCLPIRRARTFAERNTATGVLLRRSELVTNAGRVLAPRHQQRGTISEEEPVFHIDEDVVQEERAEDGENGGGQHRAMAAHLTEGGRRSSSRSSIGSDSSLRGTPHTGADGVDDEMDGTFGGGGGRRSSSSSNSRHSTGAPQPSTSNPPAAGSEQQQQSQSNSNNPPDTSDDRSMESSTSNEADSSGSSPSNGGGSMVLPAGWSMQVAPNGRVFFIDHNERKTSWVDPRTGRASPMPVSFASAVSNDARKPEDGLAPLPEGWEERVHSDGRIFLSTTVNSRTTQWEDPRLSIPTIAGQAVPYSRDYKRKYEYLKAQLRKPQNVPNKIEIKVRRSSIMEDSYRIINSITKVDLLKTKLWIEFEGETGLDYGGLAREWFYLLSKEMFNPYYGLFEYSAMDNYTLQINPYSGLCNEEHLLYFRFIGRVAGMAVYHGKLLDAFFIRPFYKMMLQKPIELKDMEAVDTEYYNSLVWIKEYDPSELALTFCVDEETFGATSQRELKPNGAEISVTEENKDEYIKLVIEWRFVSRVQEQMSAFLDGFGSLVPLNLLKIFDENELELLMCGIQSIDLRDWKRNTLYKGDYYPNHLVIQWFWRAVLSFSNEMRARLLQFVTGTSRVPMNGFKELHGSNGPQMFTIEKWGTPDNFPRAHTCFNRLDLPPYESYLQLKDRLVQAVEGSQGFAGVD